MSEPADDQRHDPRCAYDSMKPITRPCTCAKIAAKVRREDAERARRIVRPGAR